MLSRVAIFIPILLLALFFANAWNNETSGHNPSQFVLNNFITTDNGKIFEISNLNCSDVYKSSAGLVDDCALCACATNAIRISFPLTAECNVSIETLQRLMTLLQRAWEIIAITESRSSLSKLNNSELCSEIISNKAKTKSMRKSFATIGFEKTSFHLSSSCEDLIVDMEELIVALTEQIKLLVESLEDSAYLWARIVQLQNCVACLNRKMSDLEQDYGQQLGNITQQLINMKDCFILEIRRRAEDISRLQERLDFKSFQLISANVNASNYTAAVAEFIRLENPDLLPRLIVDLYNSQKIENILTFGILLNHNNADGRAAMYEQLQDLIGKDHARRDIHQVLIYKVLSDDSKTVCNVTAITWCDYLPFKYFDIIKKSMQEIDRVVTNWAGVIRQGLSYHRNIWIIASPDDTVNMAGEAFHDILEIVVNKSLDLDINRNFINTLDFVCGLRWNKHRLEGFKILFQLVRNNIYATMKLAYEMKKSMESLNGPDGRVEDVLDGFLDLKKKLPQHVRHIVWGSTCILKIGSQCLGCNSGMEVYNRNSYFTGDCSHEQSKWELVLINVGIEEDKLLFKLRHVATSAYFGSHTLWKNNAQTLGVTSCSIQDFEDYPNKHYLWSLRLQTISGLVGLFHVARMGPLTTFMFFGPIIGLTSNGINLKEWEISCQE